MALRSTQPLTEMSTRNVPDGKGWSERMADNLAAICELIFYRMWEPRCLITLWASTACYRESFILPWGPSGGPPRAAVGETLLLVSNYQHTFLFPSIPLITTHHYIYRHSCEQNRPDSWRRIKKKLQLYFIWEG
jgi:hypothetical protein